MTALLPPAAMVDACCEGLRRRSELGRGGTARSVPFAIRVCGGEPINGDDLKDMLAHFAALEREMEHRLGDPVLETAWLLWGGDAGVEWADGYLSRALAAAPNDPQPEQPEWMARLNQLARDERALLARIHELCEAGMEVALSKVHAKVVNALARPSQALKASLGGLDRRDEVLAAMREHPDPAVSLAVIPRPLMARLGPTAADADLIRSLFAQHTLGRVDQLVAAHQAQVVDAFRQASASPGVPGILADELAAARTRAVERLGRRLLDLASEFLSDANPLDLGDGEVPVGRVPGSLAWDTLSDCGGGNPDQPATQDWATVNGVDVLASGVAVGVLALRTLDRLSTGGALLAAATLTLTDGPELDVVTVTTWRWGGSKRPFPPHQQLDGQTWETEADRAGVVRNTERFPPGEGYYPGDHAGCSCSLEVELRIRQVRPGRATGAAAAVAAPDLRPRVLAGINYKTGTDYAIPERKMAAIQSMADQLHAVYPPPNGKPMSIVLTNSLAEFGQKGVVGVGMRGSATNPLGGRIILNARRMDVVAPTSRGDWSPANATKVTDAEFNLIHEWGHTIEVDQTKTASLFARLVKGRSEFPSGYAATNEAEMFAEAFADFHIDPATAHPTSLWLAKELGWAKPAVPLANVSALRRV